jgi:hypothetical protein
MQAPFSVLEQFDRQSRLSCQTPKQYHAWLLKLRDALDIKIDAIEDDFKEKYIGSEQEEIDREQDDLTNSQMQ